MDYIIFIYHLLHPSSIIPKACCAFNRDGTDIPLLPERNLPAITHAQWRTASCGVNLVILLLILYPVKPDKTAVFFVPRDRCKSSVTCTLYQRFPKGGPNPKGGSQKVELVKVFI